MRQRNDTGHAWTFMGDPPVRVLPGDEHDHDVLLDGWTAVDENEPAQEEAPTAKTTSKSKRATAADTEGGEPQ